MLAPSPCCKSCQKRISHYQERFRLLRLGTPMLIDRLIEIDLEEHFADIQGGESTNYKKIFKDLGLKARYEDFMATSSLKLDAPEIYARFGIRRLCCMEEIAQPHVIPDFADKRPPSSQLAIHDGNVQKFLRMKGREYMVKQVYPEDSGMNLNNDVVPQVQAIKVKRRSKKTLV